MACVITFNNKKYSYEDFATMLVSGELDKMIGEGLIDKSKLSGDMSVLSKGVEQEMPGKPADQFSKLEGEEAENKRKERSSFKYFKAAQDALPNSKYSKEEVEEIIKNGDFTVLTGENPMGDVYSDADNVKLNEEAEKFLKEKGYDYIPVAGKYGQTEHSFLVPKMSKKDAMEFALMFNQESVLTPDGLIYQSMKTNDRLKSDDAFGIDVAKEGVDMATAIRLNDGELFGFKVGADFSQEGKAGSEYQQAMSEAKSTKKGISSSRVYSGKYIADQAIEMGSDQGGISDFTAKKIAKENYVIEKVSIDSLREADPDLDEYLNSGEVREFEGEPFQMEPIVSSTGEVLDGYNRIAQSLQNGETEIEINRGVSKKGISSSRSTGTASNLRGTIERVAGTLDESVREEIEANPEAYIDPLKINEAKAKFSTMTDQDLIQYLSNSGMRILSNDPESNIGLLAKIEIIKRAQNSPDQKFDGVPLSSLIVDAAKLGSIGGRILRMMRELNVITPSTYSDIVIRMIENTGAVLSEDNKASIRLLATDVVSTGAQTAMAEQAFEQDPSRANQIALMSARKAEQAAIDAMSRYIEPKMPVDLAKSFISNMQGNLLNVQSLGVNLTSTAVGNGILFLPKAIAKTAISLVNKGVAFAFKLNNKNVAEVGYLLGLKYYVKGFAPALSKAWGILRNGTDAEIDAAKGVIRQSIKPSVMLDMLFNSKEYARRVKGKKEYSYRMANGKFEVFDVNNPGKTIHTFAYEDAAKQMAFEKSNPVDRAQTLKYITKTVTGLAPEAMFRIMAATDTLIREPNQAYINAMFGTRLGLKGEDLASFVFDPGKDYADYLKYQGAKSVFQEDRRGTQIITNALRELENSSNSNAFASAANVVVRTSIPYVKTPANIVTQYMNYALPFIPMYRSMQKYAQAGTETSEAKKRILMDEAEESMSIAFVGFGLWAAFTTLAISKLITAGYDHYDDDEKAMMTKIGVPFSAINTTALKRMMDGGSIEPQPGDEYVALKYFGLPGMIAQMHGNRIQKEFNDAKKEGKVFNGDMEESMTAKFFEMFSVSDVMGTAFDQSFAAGVNTLFGVMRDPESKTTYAARGYAQSIVAGFGVPATFSKAMEAEYIPNLTDKSSAVKTFRNVFMYRMAGITDGVPSKIDVFGRKLAPYTPEGADPMVYNTFYPFKINKSSGSSVDYTLYKVMVETKDPGVIPSMYKQQDIMDGLKSLEVSGFRPTPADVEALNIDRGQRRLQYLTETMNGDYFAYFQDGDLVEVDSFDKLPAKDKAYHIKKAYKNADAEHIKEFRDGYITKIAQGLGAKFKPEEEVEEIETEE